MFDIPSWWQFHDDRLQMRTKQNPIDIRKDHLYENNANMNMNMLMKKVKYNYVHWPTQYN